jgi:hypothetical protein
MVTVQRLPYVGLGNVTLLSREMIDDDDVIVIDDRNDDVSAVDTLQIISWLLFSNTKLPPPRARQKRLDLKLLRALFYTKRPLSGHLERIIAFLNNVTLCCDYENRS